MKKPKNAKHLFGGEKRYNIIYTWNILEDIVLSGNNNKITMRYFVFIALIIFLNIEMIEYKLRLITQKE